MPVQSALNEYNDSLDAFDNIILLNKLDGGLVDAMDADLISEGQLSVAENVYYDNHVLNLSKGSRYYGNEMTTDKITSIYFFTKY